MYNFVKLLSLSLFFSFYLTMFSCKSNSSSSEALYTEVMEVHDKIMPEMATIQEYKKQLKAIQDTTNQEMVLEQLVALDAADENMMAWMANFSLPADEAQKITYLTQEKESINNVAAVMYSTLNKAKIVVDSLTVK